MKNYEDLGGCYPPRPTASTDNTLLDLHNSSWDTQPHSLIVKYLCRLFPYREGAILYFMDILLRFMISLLLIFVIPLLK